MIDRRQFLGTAAGTAILGAPAAYGQQAPTQPAAGLPVLGFLNVGSPETFAHLRAAFLRGLAEGGFEDGRNVTIVYRWAMGDAGVLPQLAAELIALPLRVLVSTGGSPTAMAARRATQTIPTVFIASDPIGLGLVDSIARPTGNATGGNLTGISTASTELSGKRVQLLREVTGKPGPIAFLGSKVDPNGAVFAAETEAAARSLGITVHRHLIEGPSEFAAAFAAMTAQGVSAVVVQPLFVPQREAVARLALEHRLALAGDQRAFAEAGALMAFGPHRVAMKRKMADFVAKILRGAKPADLPVEQPTEYELIVNLRTARALGLTIPPALLVRADGVIE